MLLDPGDGSTLTVLLDTIAPAGALVQIFSSNSGVALVPEDVTVPAGAASATFDLQAALEGIAVVTVALNGSAAAANVTVGDAPPPPLDAGPGTDAASTDAGPDSGGGDAGMNDAGMNDAGMNDAGTGGV